MKSEGMDVVGKVKMEGREWRGGRKGDKESR